MANPIRSIWWATATLTGAALVSRALGMIYRVLLARYLGAEGLGFYQMVFPLFVTLVTLATMGTPVAVSQLVADERADARRLVSMVVRMVLATAVGLALITLMLARPIAVTLYHDPRFAVMLRILAPAVALAGTAAVLRGYLVGKGLTQLPAGAQVVEQAVRVLIIWLLLALGLGLAVPRFWIAAALVPLGEGVSLAVLILGYRRQPRTAGRRPVARRSVLALSLPVMSGRLLGSLTGVVEAALIPLQLRRSGLGEGAAVAYFGKLTGMALPMILFPTALTVSLATNLVPAVARANAEGDRALVHRLLEESLRATAYLTVPVTMILLLLGRSLDDYVFHAQLSAGVFIPLVLGAFFLYFDIAQSGVLRGLGHTAVPLQNDLWASLGELLVIGAIGARPGLGREGIAVAVALGFVLSWALNLRDTIRLTGYPISFRRTIAKPLVASLPLFLLIPWWIHFPPIRQLGRGLELGSAVGAASALYLAALKATGVRWSRLI